jgi:hypothetical protein
MTRKPVDMYQDPTISACRDESLAAVAAVAADPTVDPAALQGHLKRLEAAQLANDNENLYSEPHACEVDAAIARLRAVIRAVNA